MRGRLVFGLHPVLEHLRRASGDVREVWLSAPLTKSREEVDRLARSADVVVHRASPAELDRLCGSRQHQGAVASLREFTYAELEDVAERRPDILVVADGIEDPRNLGALIRGVAAAGAGALIISRDRAAQVTPVAEKASAGVTAWFPVVRVVNLARTLETLKSGFGYWAVVLAQDAERDLYGVDVPQPTLLVVGGESGVRPLVRQFCDIDVRIPMAEGVESLNVSVAAAVGCFELRRRRAP